MIEVLAFFFVLCIVFVLVEKLIFAIGGGLFLFTVAFIVILYIMLSVIFEEETL